jgi:hypothetical protein
MTRFDAIDLTGTIAAALVLASCASGSSGYSVQTPVQVFPSTPAPVAAAPLAALVAPAQTGSPAVANDGTTVHPLLLTAVDAEFGGDAATTGQGGTVAVSPGGQVALTINNPALHVTNVTQTPGKTPWIALPGGGTMLMTTLHDSYTEFGTWLVVDATGGGDGVYVGGYDTPPTDVPAAGTAVYTGTTTGLFAVPRTPGGYTPTISGSVRVTADFGARSVDGAITNLRGADDDSGFPLNDVGFSAVLDGGVNRFSGTTRVTSPSGGFAPNAAGVIEGRFFGPAAQSVGAVWTLSDDRWRMIGSFGAHR